MSARDFAATIHKTLEERGYCPRLAVNANESTASVRVNGSIIVVNHRSRRIELCNPDSCVISQMDSYRTGELTTYKLLAEIDRLFPEIGIYDDWLLACEKLIDGIEEYVKPNTEVDVKCYKDGEHADFKYGDDRSLWCAVHLTPGVIGDGLIDATIESADSGYGSHEVHIRPTVNAIIATMRNASASFESLFCDPPPRAFSENCQWLFDTKSGNATHMWFNRITSISMVEINGCLFEPLAEKPAPKGYFRIVVDSGDKSPSYVAITDGDVWYQAVSGIILSRPKIKLDLAHIMLQSAIKKFVKDFYDSLEKEDESS